MSSTPLVDMKGITKKFGSVVALQDVDFKVGQNEVVGLVGDNGAGKSTLIKILSGVFPPTEGEIYINGDKVYPPERGEYNVEKAHELSIETVFQEKSLGVKQSIWRNIFVGRQPKNKFGFIDVEKAKKETAKLMGEMLGFAGGGVSSESKVVNLSGGERQGIAIARALYFDADLIILDEPTTSLSLQESRKVTDYCREIKKEGKSAIYISHNIQYTYPASDRFVILDQGRNVLEMGKEGVSLNGLRDKMIKVVREREDEN